MYTLVIVTKKSYFNPHLRMGGDWEGVKNSITGPIISIHTSVWEVTEQ